MERHTVRGHRSPSIDDRLGEGARRGKRGPARMEIIHRAFEMLANTAPFDVTGHPAMSVPCGLPAGMMLVAKPFDEVAIYRAASAFEKAGDWTGFRP
jgi:Asp-tRNA(Asn)/Glu-tRNA(Gln) amidotransferase A subunit family amidase